MTTRFLTAPLFGMRRVLAELTLAMDLKATYVYSGQQLLKEEPVAGSHTRFTCCHTGLWVASARDRRQ